MPANLAALLAPIAAALLPGWSITCASLPAEAMPIPGALAVCSPTPTRSLAHVDVLEPWPEGESLTETLWHELTHALLSPLTALIPESDGAVMVEEQAVERLGILLSKLAPMARAAVLRGVDTYGGAPLRARISALAPRARSGGSAMAMNPDTVKKLVEAIQGNDAASMMEIGKQLLVEAASGAEAGAPPGDAGPPTDPAPAMGKDPAAAPPPAGGAPPPAAKVPAAPPPPAAESADARKARLVVEDMQRMHKAALPTAIGHLITGARARVALTPATEKRLMACATFADAEATLAIVEEAGGGTSQRGRSGVEISSAPDTSGAAFTGEASDKLIAEGLDEQFIARYQSIGKAEGAEAAAITLKRGRDAIQRKKARIAKEQASKAVPS